MATLSAAVPIAELAHGGSTTPHTAPILLSVHTTEPMTISHPHHTAQTYIQQHPNYPHWGYTVSFTPTDNGRVLVITDTEYVSMSKADARYEWRQNAAQGWKRLA